MEIPSVLHPTRFKISGVIYELVTYSPVSDEQAAQLVQMHHRLHPPKKKDQGKVIRVITAFDPNH